MKKLHLKSVIVGLVFGVMSVVIMNNYFDPIEKAYAKDCPSASQIKDIVNAELNSCRVLFKRLYCLEEYIRVEKSPKKSVDK